jgi:addiction module RelE/StbE family toxin
VVLPVEWSPEAGRDVENIKNYIRRDSEFYARVVAEKIIAVGRKIETFPKAGRIVPELNDDRFRERSVYSYRVIYRVREDRITVLAVVHGKRLLSALRDRFGD